MMTDSILNYLNFPHFLLTKNFNKVVDNYINYLIYIMLSYRLFAVQGVKNKLTSY